MTARPSWTLRHNDGTIEVRASVDAAEPMVVLFRCYTGQSGNLDDPTFVVRRGVDEPEPTVRHLRIDAPDGYERLDDWESNTNRVAATREIARWHSPEQLLALCRLFAQAEVDRTTSDLHAAEFNLADHQERLRLAHRRHHRAILTNKALSLASPAARSSAMSIVPTFHGDGSDLQMIVDALTGEDEEEG